jgi:EAL domain-containing protein (putative c-di-GMP-specific phosphodiesterase class I)/GGDEF domain-containing protein
MPQETPRKGDADLRASFLELKSALFDRNTGLYAVPYHFDDLQRMVEWRPALGLLHLELSDFERVEWLCGWQAFDGILSAMAEALRAMRGGTYPSSGLLAVAGVHGGTFILFLPETSHGTEPGLTDLEASAGAVRRRLVEALRAQVPREILPEVQISAGYGLLRCEPVFRIERLVYRAMEEARLMAIRTAQGEDLRSGAELRQIIRAGLVETHFQPIIDVTSGGIFGYEALTRGPRGTMFETPKAMFGCSDRMRISALLDSVCRRRALHAARGMQSGQKLFVNSLPASLADPRFADEDGVDLRRRGRLAASNVVLEITERSGIDDFDAFGRRLEKVREMGFQVAIDDVGTGYSSLQSISEVRPEFLKIDLSLVQGIHQSLIKQEIVASILQIGERIGAKVIAEGIESGEEFEAVRSFGVRLGQGFFFGAPAPHLPPSQGGLHGGH